MILLIVAIISCEDTEIPEKSNGVFSGNIASNSGEPIYPTYIFEGDSLLSILNANKQFSIELDNGEHEIIFSAIGYSDKVTSISINGDLSTEIKFEENQESGRIYGEFQDLILFQQKISEDSDLANWTEKQVLDGVTGATILEDNASTNFQQAQLFIGDSLISYADVYGQYWIEIQCGTYPITGKSEGFTDETKAIKVIPDSRVYFNYYLTHE